MIADLLLKMLVQGGPYAIAAMGWFAWWYERRVNRETNQKLIDLATAQIEATLRHEGTIAMNTRVMERMVGR